MCNAPADAKTTARGGQSDSAVPDALFAEIREILREHHGRLEQRFECWMGEEERLLQAALQQHFNGQGLNAQECAGSPLPPVTPRSTGRISEAGLREFPSFEGGSPVTPKPSHFMLRDEDQQYKEAAKAFATKRSLSLESEAEEHRESSRGLLQQHLRQLVVSPRFELVFAVAIISNAVLIGAEVEVTTSQSVAEAPSFFRIVTHLYAFIFLVELFLRLGAYGRSFFCTDDWAWNLLDIFIVVFSLWEAVMDLVFVTQGSEGRGRNSNITNVRILRIVRISRLIRITRISRLMRFVKALRTLVYSIICTLKSLVWALLLIGLLIYVFGIFFAQVIDQVSGEHLLDTDPSQDSLTASLNASLDRYWGTLGRSLSTLFKVISGGMNWQEAADPLGDIHWLVAAVFYMFIAFAHFAVLNVITGVFCQSAIESAQRDQDLVMQAIITNKQHHVKKLRTLFKNLDSADSGCITLHDLERNMQDAKVQAYFNSLDLDVDDAWTFFKLLDTDREHAIQLEDFLLGCNRLRGYAKALDIAKLMHEQEVFTKRIASFMLYVEGQFQILHGAGAGRPPITRQFSDTVLPDAQVAHALLERGHGDAGDRLRRL